MPKSARNHMALLWAIALAQTKAADAAAEERMAGKCHEGVIDQVKAALDLFGAAGHLFEDRKEIRPITRSRQGTPASRGEHEAAGHRSVPCSRRSIAKARATHADREKVNRITQPQTHADENHRAVSPNKGAGPHDPPSMMTSAITRRPP